MAESLQKKTFSGVIWSFAENFSLQGIQFVIGVFMARVLTPSDYGMVGMLAVFMAVSQTLINSGFSSALVRKTDRQDIDFSTVFYFNVIIGAIMYLMLFLGAPYIADFYKTPLLKDLTRVIAITLMINSLCQVQQAKFTIKMDFKTQAKISIISSVITGVLGLIMAYTGFGVWAIAYSSVVGGAVRCILLWLYSKWLPQWAFSWTSFRELFSFGSKLLASGLLDTIYNNIYPIVIGKKFAATDLGFYSRADGYSQLPATTVTGVLSRVTFPMLCEIQQDDERLERIYRQLLRLSAFVVFPVMMGFAALARPLVLFMITEKWEPSIVMLQILCFALMWYPIHALNLNLLQVKGRSDLFLKLEVIKKILGVATLCVSIPLGLIAMCIGRVFTSIVSLVINTYYTGKLIHVGFFKQMQDLIPLFLYSLSMGGLIWIVTSFLPGNGLKIIVGILTGIVYYVSIAYITKSSELMYLLSLIRRKK